MVIRTKRQRRGPGACLSLPREGWRPSPPASLRPFNSCLVRLSPAVLVSRCSYVFSLVSRSFYRHLSRYFQIFIFVLITIFIFSIFFSQYFSFFCSSYRYFFSLFLVIIPFCASPIPLSLCLRLSLFRFFLIPIQALSLSLPFSCFHISSPRPISVVIRST